MLGTADLDHFRPGRPMIDIMAEIQWRGNFEQAVELGSGSLTAISYTLLPLDSRRGKGGEVVWAIFRDEKFEKFVAWPKWDMELVEHEGNRWSRARPIRLGDFLRLLNADQSEALDVADVEAEVKLRPDPPHHVDPSLTIVWLLLSPAIQGASAEDYARNAALRDQFNAARLAIGMSEAEVASAMPALPLHTGVVDGRRYKIYGSRETFDIRYPVHYANILVLFERGRATGIYSGESAPGGSDGLAEMQDWFVELFLSTR